jgi:hypothetical protein
MKKLFIIAFLALGFYQAQSQVTFKPGLRGGLNFSHFTKGDSYNTYYTDQYGNYVSTTNRDEYTSKTDFYVGFYGALKLSKFYTLQPEINYSNQGSTYKPQNGKEERLDISYLSVGIVNKFSFNNKFSIHLGPTIDFVVDENVYESFNSNNYYNYNDVNDVDLAFILGAGYDINKNIGIEARVKKGVIPAIDFSDNHTNVVFSVGATYTFDVK